ncbi:MAG TPA: hypothetical protein VK992_02460 [Candidatus Caenarcaniphilales bacterium]|nr:hypothetical protein [Candidatus Caenarcaniphilales bacterium]
MFSSRALPALALALGLLAAVPAGAAAAPAITVEVIIGQPCISGTGPADTAHVAALRTPSGAIRGRFRTRSDESGFWGGCFPFDTTTFINGGDRLRVTAGTTERKLVIPRLEPHVNRMSDVVSGRAAPGTDVDVMIEHRSNFRTSSQHFFPTMTDADGRYRIDTTAEVDLLGGDLVLVLQQQGADSFGALGLVPHMRVSHANNVVSGSVNHGTDLRLELRNADGETKANVTAGPIIFGIFSVAMFRSDGRPAYPVGGDLLVGSFAGDARLRMPFSYLNATASDDVVRGRCMARAPYELWAGRERFTGRTDSTGRLQRDVTNRLNLRKGDELVLNCMYDTGDNWTRTGIAS